jgi:hypothetical protein
VRLNWFVLLLFGVFVSACSNSTSPSSSLAGTWSEQFSIPGPRLALSLDASGNGSGNYAIEAGRSGSVQVFGSVAASTITLSIHYGYGLVRIFNGTLIDASHLTGTFADAQGTVVFLRS